MSRKAFGFTLFAAGALLSLAIAAPAGADPLDSCAGCHGKDGVSADPKVPTIAGMSGEYLKGVMKAYATKARPCPPATVADGPKKGTKTDMCQVASGLSDADTQAAIAALTAKKYVKATQTFDAALAAKGKDLHANLCEKCHTENGTVPDDDSGFLGGQWAAYLTAELNDYMSGKRTVPTKMKLKLDQVQPADVPALVNYYSSIK